MTSSVHNDQQDPTPRELLSMGNSTLTLGQIADMMEHDGPLLPEDLRRAAAVLRAHDMMCKENKEMRETSRVADQLLDTLAEAIRLKEATR